MTINFVTTYAISNVLNFRLKIPLKKAFLCTGGRIYHTEMYLRKRPGMTRRVLSLRASQDSHIPKEDKRESNLEVVVKVNDNIMEVDLGHRKR